MISCEYTTISWLEDEFGENERISRKKDGKQFYVPCTMKYNEWKEKYLVDKNKVIKLSGIDKEYKQKIETVIDYLNEKYPIEGKLTVKTTTSKKEF